MSGRKRSPWATLSVLLLGCFIANADSSLVLATYGKVASEFHDLDSGSWLLSSYILAMSAVQPLYGKLSDIYGRKPVLLVAYAMFALGNLGAGLGRSLGEVIAWRAVQGIGGAGMGSLVAIIIVDIVPMHDVASTRSYVNIMQTSGRTCGGVIGGWLTQTLGWRW
jgi:MFS family permease